MAQTKSGMVGYLAASVFSPSIDALGPDFPPTHSLEIVWVLDPNTRDSLEPIVHVGCITPLVLYDTTTISYVHTLPSQRR